MKRKVKGKKAIKGKCGRVKSLWANYSKRKILSYIEREECVERKAQKRSIDSWEEP